MEENKEEITTENVEETTKPVAEEPVEETPNEEVATETAEPSVEGETTAETPAEQPKKSKGVLIAVIVVAILGAILVIGIIVIVSLLFLTSRSSKKPNNTTTSEATTEETTTETTTTTASSNNGKLKLYTCSRAAGYMIITNYSSDCKTLEVECKNKDCTYEASPGVPKEEDAYAIIKDGKYYYAVDKDGKIFSNEIGKDYVDKNIGFSFNEWESGVKTNGDKYMVAETDQGTIVFTIGKTYNYDTLVKNTDLDYCEESACHVDGIDYLLLPSSDGKKSNMFNLSEDKVKYIFDGIIDIKGNKDHYYFSGNGKTYDSHGTKILDSEILNYTYEEYKYFYTLQNNKLQKRDLSFNVTKETSGVTSFVESDEGYVVAISGSKINLYDEELNLYKTLTDDYDPKKYEIDTHASGWWDKDNNGKKGIFIVVEITDEKLKEQFKKDNPNLNYEDDGDGLILGYEYYYYPDTKESGRYAATLEVGGYAKPVLYLYPEKETNVTVTFKNPYMLTTTYPKYINKWEVTAKPNGDLYDKKGKYYYALYWEELKNHEISFDEGFYVEGKDAINFLEDKLSYIGLNEKERNEFIMYWLPILEKNGKNLIYFELTEERDKNSPLIIEPKPDSILRLAMHVKKVDKKTNIKEQKLASFNRTGFTAVEWGGVIH